MTNGHSERRAKPRARGAEGLTVKAEPNLPAVQVKDISISGVSFRTRHPVEFMTRLMMTLVFPDHFAARGAAGTTAKTKCEGAVVRCVPLYEGNGGHYEVAVFFTSIDEVGREMLEKYVKAHQ
ncbi:MAG: PilZ domain-containing protein [Candidatus Lindowbacteria bacterium]|nr:PilZ domain-containing protein [Candidatus Lindowbacteria bacterium]